MTTQLKAIRHDHGLAGGWGFSGVTVEALLIRGAGTDRRRQVALDGAPARPELR
jgi:hypothetical protein